MDIASCEIAIATEIVIVSNSSRKNLNIVDVGQQIPVNIDMERMTCKWPQPSSSYTCTVGPGEKDQKLGGMKTFVTYGLTPSFNNIKVNRRYVKGVQRWYN